ncbi:NADPH-dependent ferric siderophore reductase [Glaciihabitans tibetensis]|uniref:NADPH-dependent ferric siderophore reductase n=1 Tax=Glaciihabitans tibetensis TaxID=1266600 RepID=A0A2T0VDR1_9MICO|nr:siderophore-interacting protein [Glaciihabitans tibetensis]PRY68311.1 NADPH-dependent ferric siderophore reductase [Glaciihabitans tibetensis]
MAQALASDKAVRPTDVRVQRLWVVRTERLSSSFVRVTIGSNEADFEFASVGYDQWLRLFLPVDATAPLALPHGDCEGWYSRLLAMPDHTRPLVRNYTVRDARQSELGWEIDIDFVVHRSATTGLIEGVGANWALNAQPGSPLGMLDQGRIFAPEDATGSVVIVADESGLPGVEGILRSLAPGANATLLLEVPHGDDVRALSSNATIDVEWIIRSDSPTHAHALAGTAALERLDALTLDPTGYVYAVGEASFVLAARKRAQHAGLPKGAIDFCAYWRPERRSLRRRAA